MEEFSLIIMNNESFTHDILYINQPIFMFNYFSQHFCFYKANCFNFVNVLNLHIIDLARKYHTHLQREIEKEEAREKEWKNSH